MHLAVICTPQRFTNVPPQVTHTVLVMPEQLDRICPAGSLPEGASPAATPFRRLIRDLLLFFEHTYRVSSQTLSLLRCRPDCTCIGFLIDYSCMSLQQTCSAQCSSGRQ